MSFVSLEQFVDLMTSHIGYRYGVGALRALLKRHAVPNNFLLEKKSLVHRGVQRVLIETRALPHVLRHVRKKHDTGVGLSIRHPIIVDPAYVGQLKLESTTSPENLRLWICAHIKACTTSYVYKLFKDRYTSVYEAQSQRRSIIVSPDIANLVLFDRLHVLYHKRAAAFSANDFFAERREDEQGVSHMYIQGIDSFGYIENLVTSFQLYSTGVCIRKTYYEARRAVYKGISF